MFLSHVRLGDWEKCNYRTALLLFIQNRIEAKQVTAFKDWSRALSPNCLKLSEAMANYLVIFQN